MMHNAFLLCTTHSLLLNGNKYQVLLNGDHETMKNLRADAYDLVLNGVEIGGGSIRIYDRDLQSKNFTLLGMTEEEAESKFGFLLGAFEYGAPPHGGIAFGFDRLCAVMSGSNSIRDFIAFPKNNQGKDIMIDAPSFIDDTQLKELSIDVVVQRKCKNLIVLSCSANVRGASKVPRTYLIFAILKPSKILKNNALEQAEL